MSASECVCDFVTWEVTAENSAAAGPAAPLLKPKETPPDTDLDETPKWKRAFVALHEHAGETSNYTPGL